MKALIAAGGFGTRLFPITKSLPKAMLPLAGKPLAQHVVEELVGYGFTEIMVLYQRHAHQCLVDHFRTTPRLRDFLNTTGSYSALDAVTQIDELACFTFLECEQAASLGEAILLAAPSIGRSSFLLAMADEVGRTGHSPVPALVQEHASTGMTTVPCMKAGRVRHCVTHFPNPRPCERCIVGRYVCAPVLFDALAETRSHDTPADLVRAMDTLARRGGVYAVPFAGTWWHCGNHEDYARAVLESMPE